MVSVFLVVIFVALLFGTRLLNNPERATLSGQVKYSERYLELSQKNSLTEAEQVEFELETCRYRRDSLRLLMSKPLANSEAEFASYRQDCEPVLPFEQQP